MPHPESLTASPSGENSLWRSWQAGAVDAPRSEDHCLELVNALFPISGGHCLTLRTTDCAELAMPQGVALSTDCFLEDIHFRVRYFSPRETGAKALTVALSDLAACGAVPLGFSLGLALPPWLGMNDLESILAGMAAVADKHGVVLTGGDISRGERLGFCVTVWGESVEKGSRPFFLRRGAARPGHALFLVSPKSASPLPCHAGVGLARAGLHLLEQEGRKALSLWPELCAAHLSPTALIEQGQIIAKIAAQNRQHPVGLMDLSDGLAADLPRLLGREAGANCTFDPACLAPALRRFAEHAGQDAESLFFRGGEDYALLGSCHPSLVNALAGALPELLILGTVEKEPGLRRFGCAPAPHALKGFDHFSGQAAPPASPQQAKTPCSCPPETLSALLSGPGLAVAARLLQCCHTAWQAGLLAGFNGNISTRLTAADGPDALPEACLITGTTVPKAFAAMADLSLVALDNSAHLAGARPSSEGAMHTGIYRACPETRAIVHTHPPALLALSLKHEAADWLNLPLVEARLHGKNLGMVEEFPAGSEELAVAVAGAAREKPAVWMKHHGLVTHGPSLEYALALAEELEQIARIALWSAQ